MPTFDTPEPISLSLELGIGDIRIDAGDRVDTTVEVRPSDPTNRADVTAAEQTRVEYANGHLLVSAPRGWRQWMSRRGPSIDVRIGVPAGSVVRSETGVATLRCSGRIGELRSKTGLGDVQLEGSGSLDIKTGAGDISVERAVGKAEIATGSGAVRIGVVDGTAVVKNSNGDTWIGEVAGDARVSAANGTISIDVAHQGVVAKTANGGVRLGEVARGAAVAQSAFGTIEVGIRHGVAAWLDLDTKFGSVHNDLDAAERPEPSEDAVEVHARTSCGDVTINRSLVSHPGPGTRSRP